MTHTITTQNSTYEVDWDPCRIRRLTGTADPTPHQGPDGEWQDASLTLTPANQLYIEWADRPGLATVTSPITSIRESACA
jgi:hypothetical protein